MPVPVPEDAMEVNALCEETDPPDMEAFFDAAGEFYNHFTGEILDRECATGNASLKSHPMKKHEDVPYDHLVATHQLSTPHPIA